MQEFGLEEGPHGLWSADVSLTFGGTDNFAPHLSFDGDSRPNFLWTRGGTANGSLYYARLTRMGDPDRLETYVREQAPGFPPMLPVRGAQAALDSNHHIHYVYDDPNREVHYVQYAEDGAVVVPDRQLSLGDGAWSVLPAVALGPDDSIHIVHSEYRFQCEDIAYQRLATDGNVTVGQRLLTANLAAVSETSLVKVSPWSKNALITFGSENGSMVGRFDKYGSPFVSIATFRPQSDFKVADVAESPDGSLHLVWEDSGSLHYTRILNNGSRSPDNVVLVNSTAVAAFPRIEADAKGRIDIVWSDNRTGVPQVWFGRFKPGDPAQPFAPFQITNSTTGATEPALAVDGDDDRAAIAWADGAPGGRDIHFKRELGCGVELYAEPIILSGGGGLHPNHTAVASFELRNTGWFVDDFAVSINISQAELNEGWALSPSPAGTTTLAPGGSAPWTLSIRPPTNASWGQSVEFSLNATNRGSPACFDAVDLDWPVIVARDLSLVTDASSREGESGGTVTFRLTLANTGDWAENVRAARYGAGPAALMAVNLSASNFSLGPGASTNFTVEIAVPPTAVGAYAELVEIHAYSLSDPRVGAFADLVVAVRPNLTLLVTTETPVLYVDPGRPANFELLIAQTGNIDIKVGLSGGLGSSGLFSEDVFDLNANAVKSVRFSPTVPAHSAGGGRITYIVNATSSRLGATATLALTIVVNTICDWRITPPTEPTAITGPSASASVVVSNNGNAPIALRPTILGYPEAWNVSVDHAGLVGPSVSIARGQSWTTFVVAAPPGTARAGENGISVHFDAAPCNGGDAFVRFVVAPRSGWALTAEKTTSAIAPGGTTAFELLLTNLGNSDLEFLLSARAESPTFQTSLAFISGDPPVEHGDVTAAAIVLGPLESAHLRARVTAGVLIAEEAGLVVVTATAGNQGSSSVLLEVTVGRSNLAVRTPSFSPSSPVAGDQIVVRLQVENRGTIATPGGRVRLAVNNDIVDSKPFGGLAVDGVVEIWINWTAVPGHYKLTVEVIEEDGGTELDLADNSAEWTVIVTGRPAAPPRVDAGAPVLAALLAALTAAAAAVLLVRRRTLRRPIRRPREPKPQSASRFSRRPKAPAKPKPEAAPKPRLMPVALPKSGPPVLPMPSAQPKPKRTPKPKPPRDPATTPPSPFEGPPDNP